MIILLLILGLAVFFDLRSRRIPNVLVAAGLPAGFILAAVANGLDGLLGSLAGAGIGIGVFLPFFVFRLIGAGDVKLFGVVGAFVGQAHIFQVLLYSLIAGGVVGVGALLLSGNTGRALHNFRVFFVSVVLRMQHEVMPLSELAAQSAVRIPYALAIAAGVLVWLGLNP
ncbi:prepilin peptidase [Zoogloea sp.]|uniref:A24 family peptidase n=1 Tax=Zoogloea sp. TaxID=49181 RepID=UPI0031FCA012